MNYFMDARFSLDELLGAIAFVWICTMAYKSWFGDKHSKHAADLDTKLDLLRTKVEGLGKVQDEFIIANDERCAECFKLAEEMFREYFLTAQHKPLCLGASDGKCTCGLVNQINYFEEKLEKLKAFTEVRK